MHGDFSRITFSAANHFSAVLSQQGRVMLDADENEASAIWRHHLRALITDLVGPAAAPGEDGNGGFKITAVKDSKPPDLAISSGRYYVGGLLCENNPAYPADPASPADPAWPLPTYWSQPDAFLDPSTVADQLPDPPFLVYLLAWERLITAAEDDAIREVALGDQGPDTTARAKLVWQVRAVPAKTVFGKTPIPKKPAPAATGQQLRTWFASMRGFPPRLRARTTPPDINATDPCITPPQSGYRGLENQLYRVEVHTGNRPGPTGSVLDQGVPTFTWSRENGSVVFPIDKIDDTEVILATMGRDTRLGLEVGDWVEVVDRAAELTFQPSTLLQVMDLDIASSSVTLSAAPVLPDSANPDQRPLLRRWDQREPEAVPQSLNIPPLDPTDKALQIQEGDSESDWIDLENGIQIQFRPAATGSRSYWHGDYWLIPARTLTGDVEWPEDGAEPRWLPPHGVCYHLAPLAIINDAKTDPLDVRCLFDPAACT